MSTQDDRNDLLSRVADRWIPSDMRLDPETRRRARFAIGAALAPVPAAFLFGIAYWLSLPTTRGAMLCATLLGGIPIYIAGASLLRWFRSPTPTVCVAIGCGMAQLSILAYMLGGALSPTLAWLIPVPSMALLMAGRRVGLTWLCLCGAVFAFFWIQHGDALPRPVHAEGLRFPSLLALMGYTFVVFALYERTRSAAVEELERANVDLEHARREAHAANQSKGAFLSRMSHEIRTPLMSILGFTDLLAEEVSNARCDAASSQRRREETEALSTLRRNGEHLLHIIDDLLDLSRIESESLRIERQIVATRMLLEEAVELVQVRAQQRQIVLSVELGEDLPATVYTDPTRLRQILVNLLGNAIKFTERGRVTLRASTLGVEPLARLRLEVEDTGIGMTPLQVEQLFQPFSQATKQTARIYGGSGLGLVISKRLTEALDGTIRIESRLGVGSTFTLELPLDEPDASEASEPAPERAAGQAGQRPLLGRTILVVDDFPDNRLLLSRILSLAGAQIELADSGAAALALVEQAEARSESFDLILMDVQMPGIDGCAATEMLRARGCRAVIVALTADALLSTRERCLRSGFDAHATKPIQRARLLELAEQSRPLRCSIPPHLDVHESRGERLVQPSLSRRLWTRLIDAGVAPQLRHDREALRRARMVLGFAAAPVPFTALAVALFPVVFPEATARLLSPLFLGIALLCASVIVLLRVTGSVQWAGNLTLAYATLLIGLTASISGGSHAPVLPWLIALPIWALPIVGRRAARVWSSLVMGTVGTLFGMDALGIGPQTQLIPEQLALAQTVSYGSLMVLFVLLASVYEYVKDDGIERLALFNSELMRARDAANAAREAKERFLATVSHEMRTPMTAILGFSELLREAWLEHPPDSTDAMELLTKVEQNGAHLLRLLNDVLDLSKIEAGKLEIEQLRVWPAQLLQELLGPVRAHARARGVRLRVKIDGALPETIEADPTRLRQLVTKLLEGAIDSATKGTIVFHIGALTASGACELVFSIERKDLEALGDIQASWLGIWGSPDEAGGLLPFTLARSLCRLLGGRLEIRHDTLVGDTIVMRLPVTSCEALRPIDRDRASTPPNSPSRAERALSGARLLLAEDSPDSQRLIAHVLRQAGARVEVAADGRTAVDSVLGAQRSGKAFDLVLMDMHMPILDGAHATRQLRAGGYAGAIVALTAEVEEVARRTCLAAGCDDFATKPIDREAFFRSLASALERRRAGGSAPRATLASPL